MATLPQMPSWLQQKNITNAGKAPSGYQLMRGPIPKEISNIAKNILSNDFGHEEVITLDNTKYFFRVEPHYDDKRNWHRGVTAYEPVKGASISSERKQSLEELIKKLYS